MRPMAKRSVASKAVGLQLRLADARKLKRHMDALVQRACAVAGIAAEAAREAVDRVAPIAEDVPDAMEE